MHFSFEVLDATIEVAIVQSKRPLFKILAIFGPGPRVPCEVPPVDQLNIPQVDLQGTPTAAHAEQRDIHGEISMMRSLGARTLSLAGVLALLLATAKAAAPRDGSHDFDFSKGVWHTHIIRTLDPFDGGTHHVTLEGTKTSRPVWGGKAWLEEIEADGPDGHWEGATLFLYDAKSGQWSQSYIDSDSATVTPPTIGSFKDGRAELFATETYKGRNVIVRGVWSDITPTAHRYEISYSLDGGRNWVTGFSAYLTRVAERSKSP